MSAWAFLIAKRAEVPAPRGARRITGVGLGPIAHRRKVDAARNRRWRRKNRKLLRAREAKRRQQRAHLFRAGGKYYERRKKDPLNRARQAAWQRDYRARSRKARMACASS